MKRLFAVALFLLSSLSASAVTLNFNHDYNTWKNEVIAYNLANPGTVLFYQSVTDPLGNTFRAINIDFPGHVFIKLNTTAQPPSFTTDFPSAILVTDSASLFDVSEP